MERHDQDIHELLKLTGTHDPAAFRALYDRYKRTVYQMVRKKINNEEEAKDVTQEIFIHLWNSRSELSTLQHFETWLYAIIRNKVISVYRKQKIQLQGEVYLAEGLAKLDWQADHMVLTRELNTQIDDILAEMPETTRNCYRLSKNEGKRNPEIAELLNLSEKTVRNNISEALKRLRGRLNAHYPELLTIIALLCGLSGY